MEINNKKLHQGLNGLKKAPASPDLKNKQEKHLKLLKMKLIQSK